MALTKVSYSLVNGAPFNVLDYGADPTGASNSLSAIQAAIDAAFAAGGGVVFLPKGTYSINNRIQPKSRVHIKGEGYGTRIISSGFRAILADRTDAPDSSTPHVNIVLSDFYVESQWDGSSPSHVYPCIELEFCNDCLVENVFVGKSDDACIRISGYRKGISSFTPSFTNPDFGFAKRNTISNCAAQEGYLGIELVGGAQCDLINNTILTSYFHGIRYAGGGWYCSASNNKVITCAHTAVYAEYAQYLTIDGNPYLRSDRSPQTGVSLGVTRNVVISNNNIIGNVVDNILAGISDKMIVSGNTITGDVNFNEATDIKISNNYISGTARLEGTATGELHDNMASDLVTVAALMIQAGGAISYRNNAYNNTKLPIAERGQATILGSASAAPTTGTFTRGDIVFNSLPSAGGTIGWVCVSSGSPGTWKTWGSISA